MATMMQNGAARVIPVAWRERNEMPVQVIYTDSQRRGLGQVRSNGIRVRLMALAWWGLGVLAGFALGLLSGLMLAKEALR